MKSALAAIILVACIVIVLNTPFSPIVAQQRSALEDGTSSAQDAPEVDQLWPPSVSRGDAAIQVCITGRNFESTDSVAIGHSPVPTRLITNPSGTLLQATVPSWMFPGDGNGQVTIMKQNGDEIDAGEMSVVRSSRLVAIAGVSPDAIAPGYSGFRFTIRGKGLRNAGTVLVAGVAATALDPPTNQSASFEVFLPESISESGTDLPVQVFDNAGGLAPATVIRASSGPLIAATITSISPDTVGAGEPSFTLTLNGANFDPKVKVTIDDKQLAVISSTPAVVKVAVIRDFFRVPGTKKIVAINPHKEKSAEVTLTVTDPVYVLSGISPSEAFLGGPDVLVDITGNNIPLTPEVRINDQALPDGVTVSDSSADFVVLRVQTSQLSQAGPITFQVVKPPPDENGSETILTATLNVVDEKAVVSTLAGEGFVGFLDGPLATARFAQPTGCAADSSGKIWVADFFNHAIRRIDINAGTVKTVAGNGSPGLTDGTVTPAILAGDPKNNPIRFNFPLRIIIDSQDIVYVTEAGNDVIRRIRPQPDGSFIVDTFAGTLRTDKRGVRTGKRGFADGPALQAKFNNPDGMVISSDGTMYVADAGNHRIRKITSVSTSPVVSTLAGGKKVGQVNAVGADARFTGPVGLGLLPDESALLVGDIGSPQSIRKITLPDATVTTYIPGGISPQDGGSSTPTLVESVSGIKFKGEFAYLAEDIGVNAIRRLDPHGAVITAAGKINSGAGEFLDGPAFDARLSDPRDLAILPNGNIVIVDRTNHRIRLLQFIQ